VLVDAATQLGHRRILRQLGGRRVGAHALTHAHPDHYRSSHAVWGALKVPPRQLTPDPAATARRPGASARFAPLS
jgi:glyoxylase-like metal-dependent hydrolase (beta-lactamase superfamily II)